MLGKHTLAAIISSAANMGTPIVMVPLYIYVLYALRAKASCAHFCLKSGT